jgi:hypothetical protein
MEMQQQILDFYSRPTAMTSGGKHAAQFDELPNDVSELTRIIQGLGLYEYVASDFYGFTIPDKRKSETHIRGTAYTLRRRRPPVCARDRLQFGAELSRNDLGQLQLALCILLKIDFASQQIQYCIVQTYYNLGVGQSHHFTRADSSIIELAKGAHDAIESLSDFQRPMRGSV